MHCSDTELVAYLDGELKLVSKFRVKRHLNACWNCRARAAALEEKIVSLSVAMDRWSFPNPWWRVDAKRRLEEGIQRLEETLPAPGANQARIGISYQIAAPIAVIFIAVAGFWWRLNFPPRINAEETIARIAAADDRLITGAVQQDLDIQIRELKPSPKSRSSKLRVVSDSRNGRFVSRWTDAEGALKHAVWKPSAGAEHIYNASAVTTRTRRTFGGENLTALADDSLDIRQLESAFLRWLEDRAWRPVSFASDLSSWSKQDGTAMTAERIRQKDGSVVIRISARRSSHRLTALLTVDVDAADYRPRLQTIQFASGDRSIELQLATRRIATVPAAEITDALFHPDADLFARVRIEPMPALPAEVHAPVQPANAIPVEPPPDNTELRAVEAQYVLHRSRTCLEEPVRILEENGRVHVRSRAQGATSEPDIVTSVATLHDVLDALSRFRDHEAIPADAPQLTRTNRTSSIVLQHAAALRHLGELFSAERVAAFPPDAWKQFKVMVMDHTTGIQREIGSLNLSYKPSANRPYTVRGWRESASTLYDKLRLVDELVADDRAADAGAFGTEVEGELSAILADFSAERESGRRLPQTGSR